MAFDFPSNPYTGQLFDTGIGPKYIFDSLAWNLIPPMAGLAYRERIFTASGTWTKPSDLVALDVTLVGGGGGGGGASATGASSASAGNGGGGGAVVFKTYKPDDLAATEAFVVGAGGASTAPGAASTFKGLTAGGGAAGTTINGTTYSATGTALGGSPAGGDVNTPGGDGGPAYIQSPAGWAKGGDGGGNSLTPGRTTGPTPGQGGAKTGNGPGCGGSGAALGANQGLIAGGAGAAGILILREWYTAAPVQPTILPPSAESRNRLLNGSTLVSQETVKGTSLNTQLAFPADMWKVGFNTTAGLGFACLADNNNADNVVSYIRLNSSTADTSIAATDYYGALNIIEGTMVEDFQWGTSLAKPAVLQFKARGAIAGTFAVSVRNYAATRCFVKNCTLADANVWQDFEIAIPADTVGTWVKGNVGSLIVAFYIALGSSFIGVEGWQSTASALGAPGLSNWLSVANQHFDFTNVGLHRDPENTGKAPPFVIPDITDELLRCMRYWQPLVMDMISTADGAGYYLGIPFIFPVPMRTIPVLATYATGSISNVATATFDSATPAKCRGYITSTGAGAFSINGRTGSANARM